MIWESGVVWWKVKEKERMREQRVCFYQLKEWKEREKWRERAGNCASIFNPSFVNL
jgi:hypothetical protein